MAEQAFSEQRFTGADATGLVQVELGPDGDLVEVTLAPKVRRLDADELAAAFMAAVGAARAALLDRVASAPPLPADDTEVRDAVARAEQQLDALLEMAAQSPARLARA